MDVDVSRMLPVTARLADKSGGTGIREPSRMMRQLLMPKLHARCFSQVWSGSSAPCRGSVRVKQKIGNAMLPVEVSRA
jgi:hypothetical protein